VPPDDRSLPEFDRYRVLERLRSDSLSELCRAEQVDLGRRVLIRSLRPGVLPSSPFASRVEREAKLLAELDHVNIVRLYDFRRQEDAMWLVLEDALETSLDVLVQARGPLVPFVAAAIALQLCRALAHAHGRGIVHRDVQPRNILLAGDGRVKLFGFSVASDDRLPTAPELLEPTDFGSPQYMSPEQVLGEAPDPRSDLFSLGVVLYELLSGKRPFDAPDTRAVTQRIRHDAPAPLGREVRDLPRDLDRVVQRLLQKVPGDRPHDAEEVASVLGTVLADAGASPESLVRDQLAGPGPARPGRPRRTASRRADPALVPGLLVAGVALVVGATAIELATSRREGSSARDGSRLELAPREVAHLRVVAEPWAHVFVDGEHVETTPFASPVPLRAGTHYVRLEHPDAPTERRTVHLAAGETVLLDVKMSVFRAAAAVPPPPLPVTGEPETP
jgi:eukaryotic-like serine/threonine-protein kinase